MQQRIVCAAIEKDGRVMMGIHYFDALMLDDAKYFFGNVEGINKARKGFLDNKGRFLNFSEAFEVALKAEQLITRDGSVIDYFSERIDVQLNNKNCLAHIM